MNITRTKIIHWMIELLEVERKEEVRFINILWDLIERMAGGMEFHRVGLAFLKALEFREVLLEFWEISIVAFW